MIDAVSRRVYRNPYKYQQRPLLVQIELQLLRRLGNVGSRTQEHGGGGSRAI